MRSICCDSYENGGSRSRTTNTSFGVQLRLGDHGLPERPRSNPVSLIRFSRANPSPGSGQDKTRIGENRANAIRIVGPDQIYR